MSQKDTRTYRSKFEMVGPGTGYSIWSLAADDETQLPATTHGDRPGQT
jgi:hypothetical protein